MRFILLAFPLMLLCNLGKAQAPATPTRPAALDNQYVRALMGIDQPVVKPGALHDHKQNRVMIYLDTGDIQLKYADGHVEDQHWKQGDIAWSPASGMHTSQNVSSKPIHIVEIELRNEGNPNVKGTGVSIIDNAQVSVYRASARPKDGIHYVAVDEKAGVYKFDSMPDGPGPFVIVQLK